MYVSNDYDMAYLI